MLNAISVLALAALVNGQLYGGGPEKQFSQKIDDGYNLLKHFGHLGPHTDRQSYGISRDTPAQCEVDQVIMVHRHGERYPDASDTYPQLVEALEKLYNYSDQFTSGSLEFLNTWESFLNDEAMLEQETYSGPYNGLKTAFDRGVDYRARYGHLWDGEGVPIFTSGSQRVLDTARRFGEGFFGYNYSSKAYMNIIPETEDQGANSLTPPCFVPSNVPFSIFFAPPVLASFFDAADRLNREYPGLNLTATDVKTLMNLAPYELNTRPYTPWADVFTRDEWIAYRYTFDLAFYYFAGPGSNTSAAVGSVYSNATLALLNQGPEKAGKLHFSFAHDTNITPILYALGLLVPERPLPKDYIDWTSPYKISDIMPMGGHLVLERLACNATAKYPKGSYVRAVLNEAVVPFNECQNGPGFSCPLSNYTELVGGRAQALDYVSTCDVPTDYPQHLLFFWNYNKTTDFNYQKDPIGYQANLITWDGKPFKKSK
uniref:ARAD1A10054p n=1 Tax=Blastobotrys adeninivorans TaxID=409370 RepID=A0A060SXK2_BLAAD